MKALAWLLARGDDPAHAPHAAEIRAEFEHHLACARAELERAGLTPAAAAAEAERRFGARARVEAECLRTRKGTWVMVNKWHGLVTGGLFLGVVGLSFALWRARVETDEAVARALAERPASREPVSPAVAEWAGPFSIRMVGQTADDMRLDRVDPYSPLGRALTAAAREPEITIAAGDRLLLLDIGGQMREVGFVDARGEFFSSTIGAVPLAGLTRAEAEVRLTALMQQKLEGVDLEVLVNPPLDDVDFLANVLPDDSLRSKLFAAF